MGGGAAFLLPYVLVALGQMIGYTALMRHPSMQAVGRSTRLLMSDPDGLIESMRKNLGEKNEVSELAENQSKEFMRGLKDLDRDPNMVANNKFVEWLDANDVWVKSQSTWGRAQHPLVISSNTEDV